MSKPVIIAVMGVTGTGKSSFIETLTGQNTGVGVGLESKTTEVVDYHVSIDGRHVILLDTPGFDDTNKSDTAILTTILTWLEASKHKDVLLSGLIYLHRITDCRITGTMLMNLGLLKQLCGTEAYKNIVLTSGRWDEARGDRQVYLQYLDRQKKLEENYWKVMIDMGAQVAKYNATRETALAIIRTILRNNQPRKLLVQQELDRPGATIAETSVGQLVAEKTKASSGKWQDDINNLKAILENLMNQALHSVAREHERTLMRMQERYEQEANNLQMFYQSATRALENKITVLESRLQRQGKRCVIM